MTDEEAKAVLNILLEADRGCASCAGWLFGLFVKKFSSFEALADEAWKSSEFKGSWRERYWEDEPGGS